VTFCSEFCPKKVKDSCFLEIRGLESKRVRILSSFVFKEDDFMLVLSRKPGEKVYIGNNITITVVEIKGNRIRIGIEAPGTVPVLRAELNDFLTPEAAPTHESGLAMDKSR
jgi:carbon storage regulator